jgi:hypothetical protein
MEVLGLIIGEGANDLIWFSRFIIVHFSIQACPLHCAMFHSWLNIYHVKYSSRLPMPLVKVWFMCAQKDNNMKCTHN